MAGWLKGSRTVAWVKRLHRDEEGFEPVNIIMILAISAMVLMGVTRVAGVGLDGKGTDQGMFGKITGMIGNLLGGEAGGGLGGVLGGVLGKLF